MPTETVIPVVAAIICANGRVFIAQRPEGKHLAMKWEFPGGKLEANESPEEALKREIREELACDIDISKALSAYQHHYGSKSIELMPFLAVLRPESAPIRLHEHRDKRWVTVEELAGVDLAEADKPIIEQLRQHGVA